MIYLELIEELLYILFLVSALLAGFWAFFIVFQLWKKQVSALWILDIQEDLVAESKKQTESMDNLKFSNLILTKKIEEMSEQLRRYEEKN